MIGLTEGVVLRRLWAWLIDLVMIAIIVAILWALLAFLGLITLGLGWGLMALLPAVPLLYHVLFVSSARAATPGQSLLGLVVRHERDMTRPGLGESIIFTGGLWLTLSIGVWPLAIMLFTNGNRALHDIASGLIVVRSDALAARARPVPFG